jgi:hypothetical protein
MGCPGGAFSPSFFFIPLSFTPPPGCYLFPPGRPRSICSLSHWFFALSLDGRGQGEGEKFILIKRDKRGFSYPILTFFILHIYTGLGIKI